MTISLWGLFFLVLICLNVGTCLGALVIAMCQVSGELAREEEIREMKSKWQ